MGFAIIQGLLAAGAAEVSATCASSQRAELLRSRAGNGLNVVPVEEHPDANRRVVADAELVVVAVKPKYVPAVLADIADVLPAGATVISVAAGITVSQLHEAVPGHGVIRAMPNTPALVGRGVTGVVLPDDLDEATKRLAREVVATLGAVVEIREEQIDALSAVSGSGPAYFYLFVEQLTEAACRLGFDEPTARRLVEDTFIGSAVLLEKVEASPQELRRQVTSPGGTTMEAVAVFETGAWADLAERAYQAAIEKARRLV